MTEVPHTQLKDQDPRLEEIMKTDDKVMQNKDKQRDTKDDSSRDFQMDALLKQSKELLDMFVSPELDFERQIPITLLQNTRGLILLKSYRVGLGIGSEKSYGIFMTHDTRTQTWSQPIAVGSGTFRFGLEIGKVNCMLLLNTDDAITLFKNKEQIQLGKDVQFKDGPIGRNTNVNLGDRETCPPIFSYCKAKGAFIGSKLEGTVIDINKKCNDEFYNKKHITVEEILSKVVKMLPSTYYDIILNELHKYTSKTDIMLEGLKNRNKQN